MVLMDLDALMLPVSEDAPCGPDLNAGMDPEYDEYYFGGLGRLPGFYVQPGVERPDGSRSPDRVFDPSEVDIKAEAAAIDSLLARSRDIRLLVLRTQWEMLAGRLGPAADAVAAIAGLLEGFGDALHPGFSGGVSDRRDAINDLNDQVTVVQPMQFAGLTGTTEVTLRKLRVARGQGAPLQDERDLSVGMLTDALGAAANRKKVDEVHGAMMRMLDGLERISRACQTGGEPFSPALDNVRQTVSEILDAITAARPDLRGADMPAASAEDEAFAPAADTGDRAAPSAGPALAQAAPVGDVVSHLHARRILEACEHYYRTCEPSSAALLLVTQARLLIGKPLVEALQALLPQQCGQAVVDFGPQTGFRIDAERMVQLTGAMPEGQPDGTLPAPDPGPDPKVGTAAEAAAAIRSVEDYFRRTERSSPVPVLLQRARSYLDRDFQAIVDELIPRPQE
jgi:type VI secretion system protein ImpA